jgi:uncharacterized damage-inducible protein DinB
MIQSVSGFCDYFQSIRRRTLNYIQVLPAERVAWAPKAGEFSCGDIIRHLGATELMFAGGVVKGKWRYPGHAHRPEDSLETLLARLAEDHAEAISIISQLSDADLYQPRASITGTPIKAWRLLMAIVEHEVHHRSQLAVYLSLLGVEPPQIYGLGLEEVIAIITG